jgi:glucan phosphoethanolaminetransferase (alkaline phosphatase superfamily)
MTQTNGFFIVDPDGHGEFRVWRYFFGLIVLFVAAVYVDSWATYRDWLANPDLNTPDADPFVFSWSVSAAATLFYIAVALLLFFLVRRSVIAFAVLFGSAYVFFGDSAYTIIWDMVEPLDDVAAGTGVVQAVSQIDPMENYTFFLESPIFLLHGALIAVGVAAIGYRTHRRDDDLA